MRKKISHIILVFGVFFYTGTCSAIWKGIELQSHQVPASGVIVNSETQEEWCSASLVGPKVVLTAAHCCHEYLDNIKFKTFISGDGHSIPIVNGSSLYSSKIRPAVNGIFCVLRL